ncbi:MAG: 1-phosphofructokinase [Candidatus Saccharibacteria bacterium]|nr:1-phosphofructokinase [Candidatus Saccharibacteria bacterium]
MAALASSYLTLHAAIDESTTEGLDTQAYPEPGGGGNNGAVAESHVNRYLGIAAKPHAFSICGEPDLPVFDKLRLLHGIFTHFVTVPGRTRTNRFHFGNDGGELVAYGEKMQIDFSVFQRFVATLKALPAGSRVAISGSLPNGMTPEFITDLLDVLIDWKKAKVLIDADADIVRAVLDSPYRGRIATIKQNDREFGNLTEPISVMDGDRKVFDTGQLIRLTDGLLDGGEYVITLGKQGIFLRYQDRAWRIMGTLPGGIKQWTYNRCGDSYVGGNLAAKNAGLDHILRHLGTNYDLVRMGLPADFASDPAAPIVLPAMLGVAAATANTSQRQSGFSLGLLDRIFRDHLSVTEVTARATVVS